jgi:elongator complex protein 3
MANLKKLLQRDFTKLNDKTINRLKRSWAKDLGFMPKHSQVLTAYKDLVSEKKLPPTASFRSLIRTRKTRTLSGVAPMAVMTKPFACPGQCIFCPLEEGMPKSYLSDEPAAQRAKRLNFDPKLQVKSRLRQFKLTGHTTDKIEIIVIGGTFSAYPDSYKIKFFKDIFNALNGQDSRSLEEAQDINQIAKNRVVGISVETRPDWVTEKEVKLFRKLGVTKVQLGVQALDEKILEKIKRGHSLAPVAETTKLLKNSGFKVCYHFMPNLPGSTEDKDLEMAKMMFQDPRFKPDYLKIYPVQVIPNTKLHELYKAGKFKTYEDIILKKVLTDIKKITPPWVRIDRLVRDISKKWVSSGTQKTNLRQIIKQEMDESGQSCQCIRCREVKDYSSLHSLPRFKKTLIETLGGQEYFLEFESSSRLHSLLRLRLPESPSSAIFPELKKAAIIRELHTFGPALALDEHQTSKPQHQGFGKKLIKKAEQIARRQGFNRLAVISAVGTREYYLNLGFVKEGLYMTKNI